jgi:hypothetical protein
MSDPVSSAPAADAGAAAALKPADFFFALGSEVRWAMYELLADGTPRTATEVAAVLKREFDGVSKHLRLMREAGVLALAPCADRRFAFFTIPAQWRREAGVVDHGFCKIRVPSAKGAVGKD